jgi:hypothetical protein
MFISHYLMCNAIGWLADIYLQHFTVIARINSPMQFRIVIPVIAMANTQSNLVLKL